MTIQYLTIHNKNYFNSIVLSIYRRCENIELIHTNWGKPEIIHNVDTTRCVATFGCATPEEFLAVDGRRPGKTSPHLEETRIILPPRSQPPRLPGQSFAIEHRVHEKKSKFRPFLRAAGVEDTKRFVAFVLGASGRLGPDAVAFLEYLRTLCCFPILRFRAISAKHNAQMALRWVRYLRRLI